MPDPVIFSLDGKTALVTGASRGIGAAIAAGFAEASAKVLGLSRSGTAPTGVTALACDLSDDASIKRAFDQVAKAGGLDVLVNAAGISLPADGASELKRFRDTLATDLTGVYATILSAYPLLKKAGGSIINITSINSVRGFPGNPGYVAAKAGLAGLTRALANDYARDGIRVNALAPGYIATDLNRDFFRSDAGKAMIARIPQRRLGALEDLDGPLLLLASDASRYMTGSTITVDGGHLVSSL
jgi:gluconate 5-dehydrogenase